MEEKRMYHVKIKNEVKEYEAGITYHDIAKEYQKDYEHEIVLVFVDGKLQELHMSCYTTLSIVVKEFPSCKSSL
mgnify:CR=1 FL=1